MSSPQGTLVCVGLIFVSASAFITARKVNVQSAEIRELRADLDAAQQVLDGIIQEPPALVLPGEVVPTFDKPRVR